MLLEFDIEKLERSINSFYEAIGVSISILYEDYSVLGSKKLKNPYCHLIQKSKKGLIRCMDQNCMLLEKCKNSKKTEMHICHAGLVEMAIPIIHNGDVTGYVMLGHIKTLNNADVTDLLSELPIDLNEARRVYESLPIFINEKLDGIVDMAEMFIKYIIAERLIKVKENADFETVKSCIYDNIDKKITVPLICQQTHLSKTALYNLIKKCTGNTVNGYINAVRIDKSKSMLLETATPIEIIAEKLGFSSTAYYSRLFKDTVGVSPSVFRKQGM